MKNMEIGACGDIHNATLYISNCTNLNLQHIVTQNKEKMYHWIYALNILGESYIAFIKTHMLRIQYVDIPTEKKNHTLFIQHYHANHTIDNDMEYRIAICLYQKFYRVKIELSQTSMSNLYAKGIIHAQIYSENHLLIKDCNFTSSSSPYFTNLFYFIVKYALGTYDNSLVHFNNCEFFRFKTRM